MTSEAVPCPSCSAPMTPDSIVCTRCWRATAGLRVDTFDGNGRVITQAIADAWAARRTLRVREILGSAP